MGGEASKLSMASKASLAFKACNEGWECIQKLNPETKRYLSENVGVKTAIVNSKAPADAIRALEDSRSSVAVIAPATAGKSYLLEFLVLSLLPDDLDPSLVRWEDLEAIAKLKCLRPQLGDGVEQGYHALQRPQRYSAASESIVERIKLDVQPGIKLAREYKLQDEYQTVAGKSFGIIFPASNRGSIGSNAPVLIGGALREFQLLLVTESREALVDQLTQHMDIIEASSSGYDDDTDEDIKLHLRKVWELLTPPDTSVDQELGKRRAIKAAPTATSYTPPLREAVDQLAGHAYVFRSRVSGTELQKDQSLESLIELMFIGDVVQICMPPGIDAAWDLTPEQVELLQDLEQQGGGSSGPWSMLRDAAADSSESLKQARETFLVCMQHLQVFAPNELLTALNLEMIDPIGFDDCNPRRLVLQRRLEENLENMLVLVERDVKSLGPTTRHLRDSPFMAKWVTANLEPEPGARRPNLSFMVYREKEGHNPPKRYEGGKTVNLPYMLKLGRSANRYLDEDLLEVVKTSREGVLNIIKDLVERHWVKEVAGDNTEEVETRASQLAQQVPLFYAFPMLGLAVFRELEAAKRTAQGERMDRVTNAPQEDLSRALADTNLDEFLATLAQPQVDIVLEKLSDMKASCSTALKAVDDELWPIRSISRIRSDLERLDFKHKKSEAMLKCLHIHVGPASEFNIKVRNSFNELWRRMLEPELDKLIESQVAPSVEEVASGVAEKIIKMFRLESNGRPRITALLQALTPSGLWMAEEAPILTWLLAKMRLVNFKFLRDLLWEQMLPELKLVTKKLMMEVIMQYFPLESETETEDKKKAWHKHVEGLLDSELKFTETVEKAMRTEFFMGRRSLPVAEYGRDLRGILHSAMMRDLRNNLYRVVQTAREGANGVDVGRAIADSLRMWFQSHFKTMLLTHNRDGVQPTLKDVLYDKLITVRYRLYDDGLNSRSNQLGNTLLIKCYKQIANLLLRRDATSHVNQIALRATEREVQNLNTQLVRLALPAQLASCIPEPMGRLLVGALAKARARTLPGCVPRTYMSEVKDSTSGGKGSQSATRAEELGTGDWGNGPGGRGATVSEEQMAAFTAYLAREGLQLVDCPGVDNNCGYYAVLSQVLGMSLEASDDNQALVATYRNELADVLEHHTRTEATKKTGERHWTSVILAAENATAASSNSARMNIVRRHLSGVRGNAPITYVDLLALPQLFREPQISVKLYNPTYNPAHGYTVVLGDVASPDIMYVRIANVPVGGRAGELIHWNVVRPLEELPSGTLMPAGKQLRPPDDDAPESSGKKARTDGD